MYAKDRVLNVMYTYTKEAEKKVACVVYTYTLPHEYLFVKFVLKKYGWFYVLFSGVFSRAERCPFKVVSR